ncbi:hypothetical protein FACS189461_4680 [Spirochaetia bacterium]|nr:hypothetical protein FACS189461_4680 [Spirochaetia bacterium]
MDFSHDYTLSPNIRERFLAYRLKPDADRNPKNKVQAFVVIMNNFQEGTFSWESDFDFEEEEYNFNFPQRVDENGVHYKSFKVTYTIFKE